MNIYEKLAEARVELQNLNLKKSGHNKFADYKYYELSDFLPSINKIFLKVKLLGKCTFTKTTAILVIYNTEDPKEKLIFSIPASEANIKNCQPVQNQGGLITYQKRYLYQNALEITEPDILDKTHNPNDKTSDNKPPKKMSDKEKLEVALKDVCKDKGIPFDLVKQFLHDEKYKAKEAWSLVDAINEDNLPDKLADALILNEQKEE